MLQVQNRPMQYLPRVLFYKYSGCANTNCAKGAEGVYRAFDTLSGKMLGGFEILGNSYSAIARWRDSEAALNKVYPPLIKKGNKKVKNPLFEKYQNKLFIKDIELEPNLNKSESCPFAQAAIHFFENLSDKSQRPIIMPSFVPRVLNMTAMLNKTWVGIPFVFDEDLKSAIGGKELRKRMNWFDPEGALYTDKAYKNMDQYLDDSRISAFTYADKAVHPREHFPSLKVALREGVYKTKYIMNELIEFGIELKETIFNE